MTIWPFCQKLTILQLNIKIMIDNLVIVRPADIGKVIGAIDDESIVTVERLLTLFLIKKKS